jgi:hypothetical protein
MLHYFLKASGGASLLTSRGRWRWRWAVGRGVSALVSEEVSGCCFHGFLPMSDAQSEGAAIPANPATPSGEKVPQSDDERTSKTIVASTRLIRTPPPAPAGGQTPRGISPAPSFSSVGALSEIFPEMVLLPPAMVGPSDGTIDGMKSHVVPSTCLTLGRTTDSMFNGEPATDMVASLLGQVRVLGERLAALEMMDPGGASHSSSRNRMVSPPPLDRHPGAGAAPGIITGLDLLRRGHSSSNSLQHEGGIANGELSKISATPQESRISSSSSSAHITYRSLAEVQHSQQLHHRFAAAAQELTDSPMKSPVGGAQKQPAIPDMSLADEVTSPRSAAEPPSESWKQLNLLEYIRIEVFGAEDHGQVDAQVNKTLKNFLAVPRQLEGLLLFGLLICVDTFLYIPAYLPLRVAYGLFVMVRYLVVLPWRWGGRMGGVKPLPVSQSVAYDLMRGLLVCLVLYLLQHVQMSRVYHYIRGQSMIKLYVLIGMVEIFDRLMCSFGQDAFDSLYWSTQHSKKHRIAMNFFVVLVQVSLHSLLLFIHVATLTVAVNSSDQAVLTLLISNNFAEIKSSVFKKFDKHNLFQLSCHDIVERFKLILFLGMIMLLNISHGGDDNLLEFFKHILFLVMGGEVLADWIKHAFITKFNQLQPSLYQEYSTVLAKDITSYRRDDAASILDHTHMVARRLAFATMPLNCVFLRFLQIATPRMLSYIPDCPTSTLVFIGLLFYLIVFAAKVLTGIQLMAHSYSMHPEVVLLNTPACVSHLKISPPMLPKSLDLLEKVQRFSLWKGQ